MVFIVFALGQFEAARGAPDHVFAAPSLRHEKTHKTRFLYIKQNEKKTSINLSADPAGFLDCPISTQLDRQI